MCEFCSGDSEVRCDDMSLKLLNNTLEVNYNPIFTGESAATESFKINFCPNCGESLKKG